MLSAGLKKQLQRAALMGVGVLLMFAVSIGPAGDLMVVAQSTIQASLYPQRQRNLDEVAAIAAKIESDIGFPAEVLIAQWAIESDWGDRQACTNNYFGIKRASRHKMGCVARTTEALNPHQVEAWNHEHPTEAPIKGKSLGHGMIGVQTEQRFADYASLEDSCRDYAWLIENSPPYAAAWRRYQSTRDAKQLLGDLAGIYWTDPGYVKKAQAVIATDDVKSALASARIHGTPSPPTGAARPIPPATIAGITFMMGNVVLGLLAWAFKAHSRARAEELKRRLEGMQADMSVQLAQAEARFQDRARNSLTDVLRGNNAELMETMDERYIRTSEYETRHREIITAINTLATKSVPPPGPLVPPLAPPPLT